jgi:hypothetical protein
MASIDLEEYAKKCGEIKQAPPEPTPPPDVKPPSPNNPGELVNDLKTVSLPEVMERLGELELIPKG